MLAAKSCSFSGERLSSCGSLFITLVYHSVCPYSIRSPAANVLHKPTTFGIVLELTTHITGGGAKAIGNGRTQNPAVQCMCRVSHRVVPVCCASCHRDPANKR